MLSALIPSQQVNDSSLNSRASLAIAMLGKTFSRPHFLFSENRIRHLQLICMKCQILFSEKNKKNILNLSNAELIHRMVKEGNLREMSCIIFCEKFLLLLFFFCFVFVCFFFCLFFFSLKSALLGR